MSTQTTPTRARGILMHVSSLPGEYGCGSFGQEAVDFIDLLAACGYTYWQTLPFGVPDRSGSPYKSYSAFAGNPLLIDLQTLYREGLLTDQERLSEAQRCQGMQYRCIFTELTPDRYALLKRASSRVTERRRAEIEAFIAARQPLSEFCEFMAKYHPTVDISNCEEYNTELFFWKFTQHAFFTQWQSIREYANAHGVKIIGDIPIYVDLDSANVHYHPELFLLDKERRPEAVAGVPPDYFSPDGQMWGNPLYNWSRMMEYIGYHGHPLQCGDAILRTISRSAADLVIFPIQDILGYGVDTRMNIPGVPEGNWGFRVTREQLATIDRPYRRHLVDLYGRNATES